MKRTIAFALFLAAVRIWMGFNVPPDTFAWSQAYKDVAHLFMGGLFVAWRYARRGWQIRLFVAMCVLEVAVAVLSRM
jgi:hypothetical protein